MREISHIKDKMDGSLEELATHSIALTNFKKEYRDSKAADNKTLQELNLQLSTAEFKLRLTFNLEHKTPLPKLKEKSGN